MHCSLRPNFFHLLARKPNLEKFSNYSNKFFHNFHLSKSRFTCPWFWANGLPRRLHCILSAVRTSSCHIHVILLLRKNTSLCIKVGLMQGSEFIRDIKMALFFRPEILRRFNLFTVYFNTEFEISDLFSGVTVYNVIYCFCCP